MADALKDLAIKENNCGVYEYNCMDGSIYRTFTLQVVDDEIIIAAQVDGMTNDFLCATLRNAANDEGKPLLMISANPIDSAKSGSRDMSANGMPFYADNLMNEIRSMAEKSTQLSDLEKRILDFELKRRDNDVFSDKSSLYEYRDLLSIMSSGNIEKNNYSGFRLFPVDGKKDYQNEGKNQIDKHLKENHELFERIDRSIRFGNVEVDLGEDFEEGFLIRLEKSRKEDPECWSRKFTYVFKICIVDILVEYLFETIKRNFVIDYKKTKKNCRIKLVDVGTDLIFNKKGSANISEKLNDNTQYQCKYDERLHLYTTEEELSNFGSGISVEVNFSGIVVPFVLFPDEMKSIEIVGRRIFRDKFASKKSFEVGEGDHFYKGSQEYYTRTNLSKELSVEKIIINERILHGKCKQNYGTEKIEINSVELRLPRSLKQAYYDLLQK